MIGILKDFRGVEGLVDLSPGYWVVRLSWGSSFSWISECKDFQLTVVWSRCTKSFYENGIFLETVEGVDFLVRKFKSFYLKPLPKNEREPLIYQFGQVNDTPFVPYLRRRGLLEENIK